MTHSEHAHPMISQKAQASATEQPTRTTGQHRAAALANACECLGSAKVVLGFLELSSWNCMVKQVHPLGKVTSLCGYLVVRHNI
jgi:hypothetical protein